MARYLYNLILYLFIPLVCARLWWRGRRVRAYRKRWLERFGFVDALQDGFSVIWVHSVSVGETIAAVPLIRRLKEICPESLFVVTTTTPAGSERVRAMLAEGVYHCYAPYDLPTAVARTLNRLHPKCLIIMETELWPNLVAGCHSREIPVLVVNARLSDKSVRGYERLLPLVRPMMKQLSLVAAQCAEDGERFVRLGLPREKLAVTGNIKFDLTLSDDQRSTAGALVREWRGDLGRPVWLVASTHSGEEETILEAYVQVRQYYPHLLLVLVPRHPDRFNEVAQLCADNGFTLIRRSDQLSPDSKVNILLGDTMGELPDFYGACDIAFVGGSLVPMGGHNLLEPAAWKKPVLSGSNLANFSEISTLLLSAGGLEICDSAEEIARAVVALLNDSKLRTERGMAAHGVVEANRGAMERVLDVTAQWVVK